MGPCKGLHVTIFVILSDPSLRVDFAHVTGVQVYLPYTPPMVPKGHQTLDTHVLELCIVNTSVWGGLGSPRDPWVTICAYTKNRIQRVKFDRLT